MSLIGQTCHYEGNLVEVLAEYTSLATIRLESGELTVPIKKLKPVKSRGRRAAEVVYEADEVKAMADFLQINNYALTAICQENEVVQCCGEYLSWSGEELPPECIYIRKDETRFRREWRVRFIFATDAPVFFKLVQAGSGGGQGVPCGLIGQTGEIHVYYTSIIRQLVEAGLRARPSIKENHGKV